MRGVTGSNPVESPRFRSILLDPLRRYPIGLLSARGLIRASLEPYLFWRTLPPLRLTPEARLEAPRGRTKVAGGSEASTWEPPSVPSMHDLRESGLKGETVALPAEA